MIATINNILVEMCYLLLKQERSVRVFALEGLFNLVNVMELRIKNDIE